MLVPTIHPIPQAYTVCMPHGGFSLTPVIDLDGAQCFNIQVHAAIYVVLLHFDPWNHSL